LKEKTSQTRKKSFEITYEMEYSLLLDAARTYERFGCPLLALHVLTQYKVCPPAVPERQSTIMGGSELKLMDDSSDLLATGALDMEGWGHNNMIKNKEQVGSKTSRAADLFSDDQDDSSDIFATKGSGQVSRAADLFADEPAQLDSAEDLFGNKEDIFASHPVSQSSAVNDIFADYLPNTSSSSTEMDIATSPVAAEEELSTVNVLEDQNLDVYKGSLVMQMLQVMRMPYAVGFTMPLFDVSNHSS
jgi:hypothetical protein